MSRPIVARRIACMLCDTPYPTLAALAQHDCASAPSYIAVEAMKALTQFRPSTEVQAQLLLSMWARRVELTEEDVRYVVTEVLK